MAAQTEHPLLTLLYSVKRMLFPVASTMQWLTLCDLLATCDFIIVSNFVFYFDCLGWIYECQDTEAGEADSIG